MNDDTAVREMLHDLTFDQPDAPVDRFPAVRRRYIRRRVTMTSAAAAAAAIAVVGAVLVAGPLTAGKTTPANRPVPSWALPWPDHRDGSVSQRTLDSAVDAWRHIQAGEQGSPVADSTDVIWYVGQRAVDDTKVVVAFEVDAGGSHRLVAGFADANEFSAEDTPSTSSWVLYNVPAPAPNYDGIVGLNLTQPTPGTADSFENWIVLLTHPGAQQVTWRGAGVTFGSATPADGLMIADVGQPQGQVFATVIDRIEPSVVQTDPQPVGVPGAPKSEPPILRRPAPLQGVPTGRPSMGEASGQGSTTSNDMSLHATGPTTIYARCYGSAAMRVGVDAMEPGEGVRVPCDGQQHTLAGGPLRRQSPFAKGHGFQVTASPLTAWRIAVVVD